jgi:2'-5' RNA ligase
MLAMRLFVAVHLSEEVRAALAAVQDRLRSVRAEVSWVRPGNLHLTLKFLGEVEAERQERLGAALAGIVPTTPPFEAAVTGVGSFGGRVPRVVWAGVGDGAEALVTLAGRVDAALAAVGFPRESRPFSPHLTLGRVRSPRNVVELVEALRREAHGAFGRVNVGAFCLMESQLHPQGSIYTVRQSFSLGAG